MLITFCPVPRVRACAARACARSVISSVIFPRAVRLHSHLVSFSSTLTPGGALARYPHGGGCVAGGAAPASVAAVRVPPLVGFSGGISSPCLSSPSRLELEQLMAGGVARRAGEGAALGDSPRRLAALSGPLGAVSALSRAPVGRVEPFRLRPALRGGSCASGLTGPLRRSPGPLWAPVLAGCYRPSSPPGAVVQLLT